MGDSSKVKFFQTGLKNLGYYSGKVDGKSSKDSVRHYLHSKKIIKQPLPVFINFESYERLMKNYVKTDANGNFKKVGLEPSNDKEDQPRDGYPVLNSDKDAPICGDKFK